MDTNDNAPVFTEPAYSFDILEDTERGSKVRQTHFKEFLKPAKGSDPQDPALKVSFLSIFVLDWFRSKT